MLSRSDKLAIYLEGSLTGDFAKMGIGILRYSPNVVACVIDSDHAGKNVQDVVLSPRSCPVVASLKQAVALGANVLVLGTAPPGGLIPPAWYPILDEAVRRRLCIVNGLHDLLGPRYPDLAPGQWIWDIRIEPHGLQPGTGKANHLTNRRVLMIGTDMAIGKMTAGLEIDRAARARGVRSEFIATGQIGITIMGRGIPLDAIRVDFACGAVEREVMAVADSDLIIVEGQGALCHPGSTSNLPLLRGAAPTHLVLCHRAGMERLRRMPEYPVPPLRDYIRLYEDLGEACGTFVRPRGVAVALNTMECDAAQADTWVKRTEDETGLPCCDPVRHGAELILDAILA